MSSRWKTIAIAPAPAGITVTTHHVAGSRDTYAYPAVALLLQTAAAECAGEEITRVVLGVAFDTGEVIPADESPEEDVAGISRVEVNA